MLLLIPSREAGCEYKFNQVCIDFGLTRRVIETKSTVPAANALSTRLMTKSDKSDKIKCVIDKQKVISKSSNKCNFNIARSTTLRMKPIVRVFQLKTFTILY